MKYAILTCRFPMADLLLVQTWNLPKFLPKLMTKICKDMPKYTRISEKWRKVKRFEKPENTGNMRKIKFLFICHGRIRTFVWSGLKSRLLGNENGICTPIVPLFCASVPRQPKSKAFGLEFVNRTVLDKNEYDLWWKKVLRGGEQWLHCSER